MAVRYGRTFGTGLLVRILAPLAALGWLAVIAVALGLLFPTLPRPARPYVVPIALTTWVGTTLPPIGIVSLVVIRRRNRRLDEAFARYGPGRALAPVARGWAGKVGGRVFNAWFSKGPVLELYLACDARTQGGVARPNMLSTLAIGLTGRQPVPIGGGLVALGADATWMRAFTDRTQDTLTTLLDERRPGVGTVVVQPDAVKLTVRYFDVPDLDAAMVDDLVGHLARLADAAEASPPTEPLAAHGLAARLRTNRGSLGGMLFVAFAITFLLIVGSGTVAALVVFSHL